MGPQYEICFTLPFLSPRNFMWLLRLGKFVHPWPRSMSVEERLAIVSARLYTLSHEEYINLHTNFENCFQQQQISGHTLNLNEQDAL